MVEQKKRDEIDWIGVSNISNLCDADTCVKHYLCMNAFQMLCVCASCENGPAIHNLIC